MMFSLLRLSLALAALAASTLPARADIWPDQIQNFTKKSAAPVPLSDAALWDEFGFQEAELAVYEDAAAKAVFKATAYRLGDPTCAYAAFFWQRPPGAPKSSVTDLAVQIPNGVFAAFGNYLMRFEGYTPKAEEIPNIVGFFPRLQTSSLPNLEGYLPRETPIPGSQRYILGPVSLQRFEPRIPAAAAAFHLGVEAHFARYKDPEGDFGLTLFSYPTPNLAKQQVLELEKLPGALVKRSGPLVAVLFAPSHSEHAQRLLADVRYQAEISWSEYVPTPKDNIGNLVVNAFILIGLLVGFFILSGAAFGGLRIVRQRLFGRGAETDAPIVLHIEDR